MTTEWLDERQAAAWRGLLRMTGELTAEIGRRLSANSQLSQADYSVLVQLTESPDGRLRASALGCALGWEQSRVSHQVARMAKRGLVAMERCPSDRRGSFAAVTPAGRAAIEAAAPSHVADVRELFIAELSTAELDTLADLSTRVLARLHAHTRPDLETGITPDADCDADAGGAGAGGDPTGCGPDA